MRPISLDNLIGPFSSIFIKIAKGLSGTCIVTELTSSDQAIVWGLVVVDRQVLIDHARRPFSAILEKNLKEKNGKHLVVSEVRRFLTLTQVQQGDPTICERFQSEGWLSLLPHQRHPPPQRTLKIYDCS